MHLGSVLGVRDCMGLCCDSPVCMSIHVKMYIDTNTTQQQNSNSVTSALVGVDVGVGVEVMRL